MNKENTKRTTAERADMHMKAIVFAIFLIAIKYAVSAAITIVGTETGETLDIIEKILALSAVAIVIPLLWWKFKHLDKEQRKEFLSNESYMATVFNFAMQKSFLLSFLVLTVLEAVSEKKFTEIPSAFFLNLAISIMLVIMSIAFFYKLRSDSLGD